jgi:uncharacterized protein with von Willebrand factor type A (vWA) domain
MALQDRPGTAPPHAPLVAMFVDFARRLRAEGMSVGAGDVIIYCMAVAALDPADLVDTYWAGRSTLVTRHDQIPLYDRVFRAFFLGEADAIPEPLRVTMRAAAMASVLQVPATEPGPDNHDEHSAQLGLIASDADILRDKVFAACTAQELAALRRIMARMRLMPPQRRTRRRQSAPTGRTPDPRRTVRDAMRRHGEWDTLRWRTRRRQPRRLVLILDVSGSMADYSRNLVQFAHSATRAGDRVEVFCFGTRLTRVTPALRRRNVDEAMGRAAKAVADWEGGTRIGDCLTTFVRDWGRRGVCRGGIVVICSDGLDRGDPHVLDAAMRRLSRLCRHIVWVNPHTGDQAKFRPMTVGMTVVAPYLDLLLSGHDLRSLEELVVRLPGLG